MTLKAGRELDAQIAVEVMGWLITWPVSGVTKDAPPSDPEQCIWRGWPNETSRLRGESPEVPRYSTDIAAAWQVVTMLNSKGYVLGLEAEASYAYAVFKAHPAYPSSQTRAETVPLAICLAALKVIEASRFA